MRSTLLAVCLFAPSLDAQVALSTVRVAAGLTRPVYATAPRSDRERVFVVEQTGRIKVLKNGALLPTPFLDLSGVVWTQGNERGLLGLAFHPNYAANRRFFVFYTRPGDGAGVLSEFTASNDPDVALPAESVVLVVPHPASEYHNGGCLQFALDGKLFVGTGDGGYSDPGDPECDAQSGASLLGKILRLDVDGAPPYTIPPDNPFVGVPGVLPEIWALGLRHPWRFSLDRSNGDFYAGDVGQHDREEIDFVAAGLGGANFGWNAMEGELCTAFLPCVGAPPCNAGSLVPPLHVYDHNPNHCAVVGGFVYRGCAIPSLAGTYFFADYCSARIWSFQVVGGVATNFQNRTAELTPQGGFAINLITSFGEDADGELYLCDRTGELFKIVALDDCELARFGSTNANSTGVPASIGWSGSASLCAADLVLTASGLPPNRAGLFFFGSAALPVCAPFGNGTKCVASPVQRLPIVMSDAAGVASFACDFASAPLVLLTAADTRYFQFWFRDPAAGGASTNTSDGLRVVFCP